MNTLAEEQNRKEKGLESKTDCPYCNEKNCRCKQCGSCRNNFECGCKDGV